MSAGPDGDGECNPGAATGIRNAESAKTAVWPNPVSETLHVQSGMAAPVEALVTDSHGKLLMRQRFTQSDFELNVGGFASGSYTLRLQSGSSVENIPFVVR